MFETPTARRPAAWTCCWAGATVSDSGSDTMNVLPPPSRSQRRISPPCASAISRAIARPSPAPWPARAGSAVKKRSNRCGIASADTPGPVSRHGHTPVRGVAVQPYGHAPARWGIAQRVVQQVGDHLLQSVGVAGDHRRLGRRLDDQVDADLLGPLRDDLGALPDHRRQVDRLTPQRGLARFDPRQVEQAGDEPLEPAQVGVDHRQRAAAAVLVADGAVGERLDEAADRGQRRA